MKACIRFIDDSLTYTSADWNVFQGEYDVIAQNESTIVSVCIKPLCLLDLLCLFETIVCTVSTLQSSSSWDICHLLYLLQYLSLSVTVLDMKVTFDSVDQLTMACFS